ncbi:S4 domain-containing protein [Thermaurantiacus sp.]
MVYGPALRLDKWLWFARLVHNRGAARDLCESRRLRLDGRVVERSCTRVRAGSILAFPRGDRVIALRVEDLPERRGPSAEARACYTLLSGGEEFLPRPA